MLFVNGHPVPDDGPHVSALDRGFTLGDGVFETMRAAGSRVFRWEAHLARLSEGARLLDVPLAGLDLAALVRDALTSVRLPQAVVRLTLSRGVDPGRGVAVAPGWRPTVVVRVLPLNPPPDPPVRAVIATTRRNERSPLSGIKSLNYGDSILARMEAQRSDADDALLRNTRGFIAGATTSNVFAVLHGVLMTPSARAGALPGTTRAFVLQAARRLGLPTRERALRPEELIAAHEAFLTNAVQGLRPLVALDRRAIGDGDVGPWTRALAAAHAAAWAAFTADEEPTSPTAVGHPLP